MDITDYFEECGGTNTLSYRRMSRENCSKIIDTMMEDLRTAEVTITFKEKFRTNFQNSDLFYIVQKIIDNQFNMYKTLSEVLLIPEYGNNNHLHFHGLITATKPDLSNMLNAYKRILGRSEIKMIKYPESYKRYLLKEQSQYEDKKGNIGVIWVDLTSIESINNLIQK